MINCFERKIVIEYISMTLKITFLCLKKYLIERPLIENKSNDFFLNHYNLESIKKNNN